MVILLFTTSSPNCILCEGEEELQQHLRDMTERLTNSIYRIVSMGLFSNHQLTFSFLLCASIMRANLQGDPAARKVSAASPVVPTSPCGKQEGESKGGGDGEENTATAEVSWIVLGEDSDV